MTLVVVSLGVHEASAVADATFIQLLMERFQMHLYLFIEYSICILNFFCLMDKNGKINQEQILYAYTLYFTIISENCCCSQFEINDK